VDPRQEIDRIGEQLRGKEWIDYYQKLAQLEWDWTSTTTIQARCAAMMNELTMMRVASKGV
jgi:hypothetical protein